MKHLFHGIITSALIAAAGPALAQDQTQERAYGWQIMSEVERREFGMIMRNLQTQEERDQFRAAHHKQMQARAKAMGIELPEEPTRPGAGGDMER